MAAPLDVFPPSAGATPDAVLAGTGGLAIEGRSLGRIAHALSSSPTGCLFLDLADLRQTLLVHA